MTGPLREPAPPAADRSALVHRFLARRTPRRPRPPNIKSRVALIVPLPDSCECAAGSPARLNASWRASAIILYNTPVGEDRRILPGQSIQAQRITIMLAKRLALFTLGFLSVAPVCGADQAMDEVFAHHQQQWITKPEFTSPLVDHLPTSTTVPSPRDVLGDDIGAPRVLHYYADILKYYRALADKSPRVKMIVTGKTEEG